MPEMVTSTYQNSVRNILALVSGTLKIFTHARESAALKQKKFTVGGGGLIQPAPSLIPPRSCMGGGRNLTPYDFSFGI